MVPGFRAELDCGQKQSTIRPRHEIKTKNMKTLHSRKSIGRSPWRSIFVCAAAALLFSGGAAFAVPPTKILFTSATYSVSENAGNAIVNVRRNGNTNGSSSVQYQTSDGTAIAGSNYTETHGDLTFGVGETNKNITIPIIDDTFFNGDKTFTVTLSNPSGATLSSPSTATVTIVESDTLSCVTAPSGLISWWPGDNTAIDIQSGNNGTLKNGATFAGGEVAQAFSLNASSEYVDLGNPTELHISSGDFTVDTWVRFNDVSGDMSIMDKMHSANGPPNTDGWRLLKQADNRFWFCVAESTNQCGNAAYALFSSTSVTTDTWYHVAVTKDSSTMSLYINGMLEDSRVTPSFIDTNTTDLLLGGNISEGAYLNGLIDEAEVFNRALSQAEIQAIYYAGSAGQCKSVLFYVSNSANNTIEKFDANGTDLGVFANSGLSGPQGLAFDSSGNLYAGNVPNNTIEKFDANGTDLGVFANSGLNLPIALVFDSSGNLYAANNGDNTIEKFDSAGNGTVFANSGLNGPYGLAFDSSGNLYAANHLDNTIEKFDSAGNPTLFANSGLNLPAGLAFDSSGNLYAANSGDNTIEKFDSAGNPTLFANSGLSYPYGLTFDSSGNLYAAIGASTIEKFDSAGNGTVFANSGLSSPAFIAVQLTAATPTPAPTATPTPTPSPMPTPTPTPKPHPRGH
jgi:sugar lactone lactonase YvrE